MKRGDTGQSHKLSLYYKITRPDNSIIYIKGLNHFCRANNLTPSAMVRVHQGKRAHHKGYDCELLE